MKACENYIKYNYKCLDLKILAGTELIIDWLKTKAYTILPKYIKNNNNKN